MTDRRPHPRDRLRPGDPAILEALRDEGPGYLPLIAAARGLHLGYVEKRVRELSALGLVERVDGGAACGLTERGRRFLRGEGPGEDDGEAGASVGTVEGD